MFSTRCVCEVLSQTCHLCGVAWHAILMSFQSYLLENGSSASVNPQMTDWWQTYRAAGLVQKPCQRTWDEHRLCQPVRVQHDPLFLTAWTSAEHRHILVLPVGQEDAPTKINIGVWLNIRGLSPIWQLSRERNIKSHCKETNVYFFFLQFSDNIMMLGLFEASFSAKIRAQSDMLTRKHHLLYSSVELQSLCKEVCSAACMENNVLDKWYHRAQCRLKLFLAAESDPDNATSTKEGGRREKKWGGGNIYETGVREKYWVHVVQIQSARYVRWEVGRRHWKQGLQTSGGDNVKFEATEGELQREEECVSTDVKRQGRGDNARSKMRVFLKK